MRHKYLYVNPRGFRNEFSVYRVPLDKVKEAEAWIYQVTHHQYSNDDYSDIAWITSKLARQMTARERQTRRDNQRAGLNAHENPVGATEITDWAGGEGEN